jgi:hypothetical protein
MSSIVKSLKFRYSVEHHRQQVVADDDRDFVSELIAQCYVSAPNFRDVDNVVVNQRGGVKKLAKTGCLDAFLVIVAAEYAREYHHQLGAQPLSVLAGDRFHILNHDGVASEKYFP